MYLYAADDLYPHDDEKRNHPNTKVTVNRENLETFVLDGVH